jgi:DNA modification methylase
LDFTPPPHPARFPVQLPEFFIKFLTAEGDLVLDPFAGSCTTGEAAERLSRKWIGFEPVPDYLDTARFRFESCDVEPESSSSVANANNSRAPHRQIALL